MRAFLCITLGEEIRTLLKAFAGDLKSATTVRAAWVADENYHITLRFLGEIDPMLTIDLQRNLEATICGRPAFDVVVDRISAFPTTERPRVLWAGGAASGQFADLVCSVSDAIRPLGFPRERKPDVFHISLARLRGSADPGLVRSIGETSSRVEPAPIRVAAVTLMESRLTRSGARYDRLFEVPLHGRRGASVV